MAWIAIDDGMFFVPKPGGAKGFKRKRAKTKAVKTLFLKGFHGLMIWLLCSEGLTRYSAPGSMHPSGNSAEQAVSLISNALLGKVEVSAFQSPCRLQ